MASELKGLRIAFLTSNEGVEQVELTTPWQAVRDSGGTHPAYRGVSAQPWLTA